MDEKQACDSVPAQQQNRSGFFKRKICSKGYYILVAFLATPKS